MKPEEAEALMQAHQTLKRSDWNDWDAILSLLRDATRLEREACAEACESVHVRPIQGAHEEYLAGKEMAIQQCARAIRRRGTDAL